MIDAFISYAQNFEDVILWRALGRVERGFYIDIGAQDPTLLSVSRAFYERGWKGLHVEPVAEFAERLRMDRPDEEVLEVAVSDRDGLLVLHEIAGTGLSTADPSIAERHATAGWTSQSRSVPCITLDTLLARHADRQVHWLKIDVEGHERQVLHGWTANVVRPWVVLIESTAPLTQTETHDEWEPVLLAHRYSFAYFDGLNRFYVADEHRNLLSAFRVPPNVFDNFAITEDSTFGQKLRADLYTLRHSLDEQAEALAGERAEVQRLREVASADDVRLQAMRADLQSEIAARADLQAKLMEQLDVRRIERVDSDARFAEVSAARDALQDRLEAERAALQAKLKEQLELRRIERVDSDARFAEVAAARDALLDRLDAERSALQAAVDTERVHAERFRASWQTVTAQLEAENARNAELANRLVASEQNIDRMERELADRTANVLYLGNSLAESQARGVVLQQDVATARAAYSSIANSKSWRITAPLRAMAGLGRRLVRLVRHDPMGLVRAPRQLARVVLLAGLTYLRKHPSHKARVARLLSRSARFNVRLRRFARAHPLQSPERSAQPTAVLFHSPVSPAPAIATISSSMIESGTRVPEPGRGRDVEESLRQAIAQWPLGKRIDA